MRRTLVLATALVLSATACTAEDPEAGPAPSHSPASPAAASGTAPGTELSYGDPATLVWQPAADVTGELELEVVAVREQRQSVFDGWVRDDAMASARPYFVTVRITNAGESDLGGQEVPLYLRDERGTLGAPWTLGAAFTPCQSGPLPAPFEAGEEARMCLVYLVPEGGRIQDMVFEPTEGYDPITWTGDPSPPPRPDAGKRAGRGRGRG